MPSIGVNEQGPEIEGYIVESRPIGTGAFGAVFRGRHIQTTRMDAIKILKSSYAPKHELERFRREIETGHITPNSNIVIFKSAGTCKTGRFAGCPFFIMEHLDAGSFSHWLRCLDLSKDNSIRSAVEILIEVCKGLQALHTHGIVHRDLKPSNILLGGLRVVNSSGCTKGELGNRGNFEGRENGQFIDLGEFADLGDETLLQPSIVKVGDFGLVRFEGHKSELTTDWIGTPDYMAPEQFIDAAKVTAAADQYAVGIILFQILTGYKPFPPLDDRTHIVEHLRLKKSNPPTPSRPDREVNRRLREICIRTLNPEPAYRYQSINQLEGSLQAWLQGDPPPIWEQQGWLKRAVHNRVIVPTRQNPVRYLSIVALFMLVLAACYNIWNRLQYVGQLEARDIVISGQNDELKQTNESLSSALDQKAKALESEKVARNDAIGKDLAQRAARELQAGRNPETALRLAVQAVEVAKPPNFETLEMLSAASQATQVIGTVPDFQTTSWSPRGDVLICEPRYGTNDDDKYSRALATPKGEIIRHFGFGGVEYGIGEIAWSPNGEYFAVANSKEKRIELIDVNGDLVWKCDEEVPRSKNISWSPNGRFFAVATAQETDDSFVRVFGIDVQGQQKVVRASEVPGFFMGWVSADAFVTRRTDGHILQTQIDGTSEIVHAPIRQNELELHSFGDQHVVVGQDRSGPIKKLIVFRLGEMAHASYCELTESFETPVWAHNGSIFVLFNDHAWRAFTFAGEPLSPEIQSEQELNSIIVSPNGSALIAVYESSPNADLFQIDGELMTSVQHYGGQLTIGHARNWPRPFVGLNGLREAVHQMNIPGDTVRSCTWSPNGHYFVSVGTRAATLWDSSGFAVTNLTDGPQHASAVKWSPSGKTLACYFGEGSSIQVRSSIGEPIGVIRGIDPNGQDGSIAWSPDGQFVAIEGTWTDVGKREIEGIRIFDARSEPASILAGHFEAENRGVVAHMAWAPNANHLATGVEYACGISSTIGGTRERRLSKSLSIYQEAGERIDPVDMPRFLERVLNLSWRSDGKRLAVEFTGSQFSAGENESGVVLLDQEGNVVKQLLDVKKFAWHPTEAVGACISDAKLIKVVGDATTATAEFELAGVRALHWSPNGKLLAVDCGLIRIYSYENGKLERTSTADISASQIIDWSSDSRYLFFSERTGTYQGQDPYIGQALETPVFWEITRLDLRDESQIRIVFPEFVTEVSIDPRGRHLAAGSAIINESPASIYVWDAEGEELKTWRAHIGLRRLAWQPGNQTPLFASAGDDGLVCLWHAKEGLLAVADDISDISSPVVELAWSGDGDFLATADTTNSVRIWDSSGKKVVSYSQADGPFAIPQMTNTVRKGPPHTEILSQDFFHLEWSADNRWLAVCSNAPEARVFCFDFPAIYKKAVDRLSIGIPEGDSGDSGRSWNPFVEDWSLKGSVFASEPTDAAKQEFEEAIAKAAELLRRSHLDAASRVIDAIQSQHQRDWRFWDLKAQVERMRRSEVREFQSLLIANELGGNRDEALRRMIELARKLGWSSEEIRLRKEAGEESSGDQHLLPSVYKALDLTAEQDFVKLATKDEIPFNRLDTKSLVEAKYSLELILDTFAASDDSKRRSELALLRALILEALADRSQKDRKFDEAAAHFERSLDTYTESNLPSQVLERVSKRLVFCLACTDPESPINNPGMADGIILSRLIAQFELKIAVPPSEEDIDQFIAQANSLVALKSSSKKNILRAAVVAARLLDKCDETKQLRVAECLHNLVVSSMSLGRPEGNEDFAAFRLGEIGPDPDYGYAGQEKALGFIVSRLHGFLEVTESIDLLSIFETEISLQDKAKLLIAVLEQGQSSSASDFEDATRACEAELLTCAFRLSPGDDDSLNSEEADLALRCFELLLSKDATRDSSPVSLVSALELGRLTAMTKQSEKEAFIPLLKAFGLQQNEAATQSVDNLLALETRYKTFFDERENLHAPRSFWAYSILWLKTLRNAEKHELFDRHLPIVRNALERVYRSENIGLSNAFVDSLLLLPRSSSNTTQMARLIPKAKRDNYEFLDLTVQAATLQRTRDLELNQDVTNLSREILQLARQANQVLPSYASQGGVPIPGFAGYANPTVFEHSVLLTIGEQSLQEGKFSVANGIANSVIEYHKQSNWAVRDYMSAYLRALKLKVDSLLKCDNPSWINRVDAFNLTLRLIRNDGIQGEAATHLLEQATNFLQRESPRGDLFRDAKKEKKLLDSGYLFEISSDLERCLVAFTVDSQNRRTVEKYFDFQERPIKSKNGSHGWTREYHENEVVCTFIDEANHPIEIAEGYAIIRQFLADDRKEIKDTIDVTGEAFFGPKGPVESIQGYHKWQSVKAPGGDIVKEYFNTSGESLKPIGIVIREILDDSISEESGFRVGDHILKYNTTDIRDSDDLVHGIIETMDEAKLQEVAVVVARDNKELVINAKVGKLNARVAAYYGKRDLDPKAPASRSR